MLNKKALATLLAVLALSLLLVGPVLADKDPPVHGAGTALHDAAFLNLWIDDNGGYDSGGMELAWPCPGDCLDHIADASLLAGMSGTELADGTWDQDWTAVTGVSITEPGVVSDEDGYAQYEVDGGLVSQYSCAWEGYDFVLVAYVLENTSDATVSGAYVGQDSDLDVAVDTEDMTAYDAARNMGYNCDEDEPYCVGLVFFTGVSSYNNGDCCIFDSDANAYAALSNGQFDGRFPATGYDDVQFIMGAGPISLAPGEEYLLGTAWVAGSSLADLQANADEAYGAWLASGGCGVGVPAPVPEEPEFVPEPGSVMLLASGLMGLAGYAGLRLRKK